MNPFLRLKADCPACGTDVWALRRHARFWHRQPSPLIPPRIAEMMLSNRARERR